MLGGDDAVLAADEGDGTGWCIVGGTLARFGLASWYGDPIQSVLVIGSDARWNQDMFSQRADSIHSIYMSSRGSLARAVLGIVPPKEIEDIVQETYVEFFRGTYGSAQDDRRKG